MTEQIQSLRDEAISKINNLTNLSDVEVIRVEYLGKANGKINEIIKSIPALPPNERGQVGKLVNQIKNDLEVALKTKSHELENKKSAGLSKSEWFDVTKPAVLPPEGHLHAVTQVQNDILDIFKRLGYQSADGLEVETDYYNFTALNMAPNSPSRDTQSTFYLDPRGTETKPGEIITRTQLSGMQVRIMQKTPPPMRVVIPGKVYRVDDVDASHGFEFWQLEGLYIDKNVKMTDLLGTMEYVLRGLYGNEIEIRFDSTYFAFVEPGVQAFMSCTICKQKGCPFCKHTGWVEIMPAGMVHPHVIKAGGLDPKEWNGFAFAIGLSRAAVLKYQIDDLRVLTNPDLRILNQF